MVSCVRSAVGLGEPISEIVQRRTERIGRFRGPERAEEYQVVVAHDYSDRIWDFDNLPRKERTLRRKYWEGFYVWLLLTPRLLREWVGVDVLACRIQR